MALKFALINTALGVCSVAWRKGEILRVRLPRDSAAEAEAAILSEYPEAVRAAPEDAPGQVAKRLKAHMGGEPQTYEDLSLDLSETPPFHLRVYEKTRQIEAGQVLTYAELAALSGSPGAARAVGQAMAKNRYPVLIPCHRVVTAARQAGGFSADGGVELKTRLLEIEGVLLGKAGEGQGELFELARPLEYDPTLALEHLRKDPVFRALIEQVGAFNLDLRPIQGPYDALGRSIVFQQLSGRSARAILARLKNEVGRGRFPSPQAVLAASDERLRKAGLSGPKIASLRDLALHTVEDRLPTLSQLEKMSDEECIEALTVVRGIGRWTVEMLLIFHLGRGDVMPSTDLGVRKGFALAYGHDELPSPQALEEFAERWRPFRSVASWYLWRASEQLQVPVDA